MLDSGLTCVGVVMLAAGRGVKSAARTSQGIRCLVVVTAYVTAVGPCSVLACSVHRWGVGAHWGGLRTSGNQDFCLILDGERKKLFYTPSFFQLV